jgi:hypothetical protein
MRITPLRPKTLLSLFAMRSSALSSQSCFSASFLHGLIGTTATVSAHFHGVITFASSAMRLRLCPESPDPHLSSTLVPSRTTTKHPQKSALSSSFASANDLNTSARRMSR